MLDLQLLLTVPGRHCAGERGEHKLLGIGLVSLNSCSSFKPGRGMGQNGRSRQRELSHLKTTGWLLVCFIVVAQSDLIFGPV